MSIQEAANDKNMYNLTQQETSRNSERNESNKLAWQKNIERINKWQIKTVLHIYF